MVKQQYGCLLSLIIVMSFAVSLCMLTLASSQGTTVQAYLISTDNSDLENPELMLNTTGWIRFNQVTETTMDVYLELSLLGYQYDIRSSMTNSMTPGALSLECENDHLAVEQFTIYSAGAFIMFARDNRLGENTVIIIQGQLDTDSPVFSAMAPQALAMLPSSSVQEESFVAKYGQVSEVSEPTIPTLQSQLSFRYFWKEISFTFLWLTDWYKVDGKIQYRLDDLIYDGQSFELRIDIINMGERYKNNYGQPVYVYQETSWFVCQPQNFVKETRIDWSLNWDSYQRIRPYALDTQYRTGSDSWDQMGVHLIATAMDVMGWFQPVTLPLTVGLDEWLYAYDSEEEIAFTYNPPNSITFGVASKWVRYFASAKDEFVSMKYTLSTDAYSGGAQYVYPTITIDPVNIWVVWLTPAPLVLTYDVAGLISTWDFTFTITNA